MQLPNIFQLAGLKAFTPLSPTLARHDAAACLNFARCEPPRFFERRFLDLAMMDRAYHFLMGRVQQALPDFTGCACRTGGGLG